MPVNEFLPFAVGAGAIVRDQAVYSAAQSTKTGYPAGTLLPDDLNKALRQATTMGAAVAQFIVNTIGQSVLDNGDVATIVSQLTLALAGSGAGLRTAADTFASSAGPFPLTFQPDGKFLLVFFDGIEQSTDNWSLVGQQIVLAGGVDPTLFSTVRAAYTYLSSVALRVQADSFATSVPGPYTLTQQPSGSLLLVFFDGIEQPASNYSINGQRLSIPGSVNTSLFNTVRIVYAY